MRTHLWTWGGTFFGYRQDDFLWTHDGRNVGKFYEEEIYGVTGDYLGEIRNENRLITNTGKKSFKKSSFIPFANVVGIVPFVNYVGYVMYAGYEDFPLPDFQLKNPLGPLNLSI